MAGLHFEQTLNNEDFKKKLEQSNAGIKNSAKTAEEQGKKVQSAISDYGNTATQILNRAKEDYKEQSQVIKQIGSDIEDIESKLKNMPASTGQQELVKEVISAKQALKEETVALEEKKVALKNASDAYKENAKQASGAIEKTVTIRTKVREAREELIRMEAAGLRGSKAYTVQQKTLGELTNQMLDAQSQAKAMADDEKYITATIQAVSGLAGVMSIAQGATGLFVGENENLQRIMMKVQSLMAITIGLEQVAKVVNKDSYISMLLLEKGYTKVAISLGISTVAAKAFMIAITGGLIIVVTSLLSLLDRWNVKRQESKKIADDQRKAESELAKTIGDSASKQIALFEELQIKYKQLNSSLESKSKFIKENKKNFDDLGVSIKSATDLENLMIKQADAYVQSVIKRSMADAGRAEAMKAFSSAIQLRNKELVEGVDYKEGTKNESTQSNSLGVGTFVYKVRDDVKTEKNKQSAKESYERQAKWYEEKGKKLIADAVKYSNEAEAILGNAGVDESIAEVKEKKLIDITKYGTEISTMWQKVYDEVELAKANSINNEFEKALVLNDVNMKKELDNLDKQIEAIKQKEIEKAKAQFINAGGKESNFVGPTIELTPEQKKAYEESQKQIIEKAYRLNDEAYDKLIDGFETYQEKRTKVQEDANKKRKQLEEEGLLQNIAEVDNQEEESLAKIDEEFASKQEVYIKFCEDIASKKEEELKAILKSVKKDILEGSWTDEQRVVLQAMIDKTDEAIANLDNKKTDKDKGAENTIKSLNEISSSINDAISGFDGLDAKIKRTLTLSTKTAGGIIKIVKGIEAVQATGDKALSAIEKTSVIITVISAAISIVSAFINAKIEAEKEAIAYQVTQIENQNELNAQIRETINLWAEANNAVFGKDQYESMVRWASLIDDRYISFLSKAQGLYQDVDKDRTNQAIARAFSVSLPDRETGLGGGNVTNVDVDKLRALLILYKNAGDTLMASKIQSVIDEWESYKEAIENVKSAISDFVGEIRTDFMASMVDMWENGTDKVLAYGDAVTKVLEGIIEKQAYSLFFSQLYDDLEAQLFEISGAGLSPEALTTAYADAFNSFATNLDRTVPLANDWVNSMKQTLGDRGYNLFEEDRTATSAQGIKAISQDSADRIDGMLVSVLGSMIVMKNDGAIVREHVVMMHNNILRIADNSDVVVNKLDRIDYNINHIKDNGVIAL